jgi:hypothetical protein
MNICVVCSKGFRPNNYKQMLCGDFDCKRELARRRAKRAYAVKSRARVDRILDHGAKLVSILVFRPENQN